MKPTRAEFRDYVEHEFAPATALNEARGLVVSLPSVHVPMVQHVAARLGLDARDLLVVGDRAQLRIFSFRRTPRAVVPAAALRHFNNRHED